MSTIWIENCTSCHSTSTEWKLSCPTAPLSSCNWTSYSSCCGGRRMVYTTVCFQENGLLWNGSDWTLNWIQKCCEIHLHCKTLILVKIQSFQIMFTAYLDASRKIIFFFFFEVRDEKKLSLDDFKKCPWANKTFSLHLTSPKKQIKKLPFLMVLGK